MITQERWSRIWDLFHAATERPRDEWESFVDSSCAGDDELREELHSLLAAHEKAEATLEPTINSADTLPDVASRCDPYSLVGRRVGQFLVTRYIDAGANGIVYEAMQSDPKRPVALKILRLGVAAPKAIRNLKNEPDTLARLHHPYIAQVYEAGTIDLGMGAVPWFAMEFVDGKPITEFVAEKNLSINDRIKFMMNICEAVQHAHTRGVIHRDLKPGNILVDVGSGRPIPKVLDFGLAKLIDTDINASLTRDKDSIAGTIPYMSPEHVSGDIRTVDVQADVYSLGVICYQLLTGTLPLKFSSTSLFDAIEVIRHQVPKRLGELGRSFRGDLELVVHTAFEKDMSLRYKSAFEFRNELERVLNDEPIEARRASQWYVLHKFVKRNRALSAALTAAVVILIAGSFISIAQAVRATHQKQLADARFDDVRGLARSMIFDVEESIRNLPGSVKARRQLVETALSYLQRLRLGASDDPHLLLEIAEGYARVARVQGFSHSPNLGDGPGADRTYKIAIDIFEDLFASDPQNEEIVCLYAQTLIEAAMPWENGPVMEKFIRAQDILEPLMIDSPTLRLQAIYIKLLTYFGLATSDVEHTTDGLQMVHEAADRATKLLQQNPDNFELEVAVSEANYWLAAGYHFADDPVHVVVFAELAAKALEQLVQKEPTNAFQRERLGASYCLWGSSLMNLGQTDTGFGIASDGVALLEELTNDDPENYRPLRVLSVGSGHVSQAFLASAQREDRSIEQRMLDCKRAISWSHSAVELFNRRRERGWMPPHEIETYFTETEVTSKSAASLLEQLQSIHYESDSDDPDHRVVTEK